MEGPFLLGAAVISALTALAVPYITQRMRRARGVPTTADQEYIDTLQGINKALKEEAELRRQAEQRCNEQLVEAFKEIDTQRLQINRLATRLNALTGEQG